MTVTDVHKGATVATTTDPARQTWGTWVQAHRLATAFLAGLVATHIATIVGYFMPAIGLPKLDWNTANGAVYTPGASPLVQFVTGGIFHYVDGIVFTLLYVVALHPRLPWRNTPRGNMAKALTFGTILAVLSVAVMTPLVYAPAMGANAGFLSLNFGWIFVLAVFLWHWLYAIHLGVIYNPTSPGDC
jgi:hypothetical protein